MIEHGTDTLFVCSVGRSVHRIPLFFLPLSFSDEFRFPVGDDDDDDGNGGNGGNGC